VPRNFIVSTVEQRSPEWFALRAGILTASNAGDMTAKVKTGEAAARRDLRLRLVLERLTGQPVESGFTSAEMQRGIDLEGAARSAYEAATGELVEQVGFVKSLALPIGCSPDGVINDFQGGVEIKCPKSTTHLGYWRAGILPAEYAGQILHTLYLTGAEWWDFASFDPRFPAPLQLFLVRTYANDVDLAAYERTLLAFLAEVDREYADVAAMLAERQAA
jgi:hypothetical protein